MADSSNKIVFTYHGCSPNDFQSDISFSEETFAKEIDKVFNTKVLVEKAKVEFIRHAGQATGKFSCVVILYLHGQSHKFEAEGDSPYQVTMQAIHKAISEVRHWKDKLS
jgi:hypothetical protein